MENLTVNIHRSKLLLTHPIRDPEVFLCRLIDRDKEKKIHGGDHTFEIHLTVKNPKSCV